MKVFFRKIIIYKVDFPVDGFTHNVTVWTSFDKTRWYYCGIGRFVKSEAEAMQVAEEYKKQTVWHGPRGNDEICWQEEIEYVK